ncbi:hypothetical protein KC19_1G289200 [Ceratodon purpureus]|uniref:4-coumarate--CoA ligase n=1 Tax=Ceratodon purpureus TaxID=3225 RepID=A0A8T0JD07_CERPU|nr:hypothetical protein KC19_1G289200 [Ceratodon purpureus]
MDHAYEANENNEQTETVPTHASDECLEQVVPSQEPHQDIIFRSPLPYNPIVVPPTGLTLHSYVMHNIENYLDRVALVDTSDGRQYTYGQVQHLVKSVASGLWNRYGIRKGDVVLVVLPNIAEFFIFVLGVFSIGAIYSGSNPAAHESEIREQASNSGAKLVITDLKTYTKVEALGVPVVVVGPGVVPEGSHSHLSLFEADGSQAPEVEISEHDVCALPYSSGTTGVCKGVMITHRNVIANLSQTLGELERAYAQGLIPDGEEHVVLGLMPFFHIYGICGICCASMRLKGKVVVMARYNLQDFLAILLKHGVTFAPIVPPILLQLVKTDLNFDPSKLKLKSVLTAAAPLGIELQRAFEAKFPGVEVHQAYGLTEYSCVTISHCDPSNGRGPSKPGSVGFLLPGLELKFRDPSTGLSLPANTPGEICVRGESTMKGYFKNPAATAETIDSEGWLHTGDVGYIDDDGDIFIVERMKELIKYKGFQVPPAELEAILISHPAIADAGVIPIPDEEAGEIPAACVVLKPDCFISPAEIQAFVASKVSTYKQVRHVEFLASIPKSSAGKILRRVLKEQVLKNSKASNGKSL